jgi:hypothetical protein
MWLHEQGPIRTDYGFSESFRLTAAWEILPVSLTEQQIFLSSETLTFWANECTLIAERCGFLPAQE